MIYGMLMLLVIVLVIVGGIGLFAFLIFTFIGDHGSKESQRYSRTTSNDASAVVIIATL